jgi:SAM domain (Sterile alpha motif)
MPPVRLSGPWGTRALRGAGHRRESPGAQFSAHAKPFQAMPLGVRAVAQQRQLQRLMDIEGWLRSLGLERYEAAFRENEIDDTILPRLTAEDLKELGVGPVGHRRKLLDAIAALRVDANANLPLPAPSPNAPPITTRATPLIVELANAATSQLCSVT